MHIDWYAVLLLLGGKTCNERKVKARLIPAKLESFKSLHDMYV